MCANPPFVGLGERWYRGTWLSASTSLPQVRMVARIGRFGSCHAAWRASRCSGSAECSDPRGRGQELCVGSGEIGTGSGALVWGRGWDGCTPAYPQVLCKPPHSGAVSCRKGRLVQMHVVGRLPTPRFCANLHILGLCRAERGSWYGCTWLTGLRRASREPRAPERGGWYRCTWLDACLPPSSVQTSTFWGCAVQKGEVGTGARG